MELAESQTSNNLIKISYDVKNVGSAPIFGLDGLVKVHDITGKLILSEKIYSCETINVAEKKEINLSFFIESQFLQRKYSVIIYFIGNDGSCTHSEKLNII